MDFFSIATKTRANHSVRRHIVNTPSPLKKQTNKQTNKQTEKKNNKTNLSWNTFNCLQMVTTCGQNRYYMYVQSNRCDIARRSKETFAARHYKTYQDCVGLVNLFTLSYSWITF